MDRYVELIGEGRFVETAVRFIAEVTLEVRAAKDETAYHDLTQLCTDSLSSLRESGIADEEIVEGGTDFHRPWYWKKQVGQSATRKLILKVADFGRLSRSLAALEPLQSRNKERKTISVNLRQPEFEESAENKSLALVQAFSDARLKATRLVAAMNCKLGAPIHVEESGWAKRNSGFSGDEDWSGDDSRFGGSRGIVMMAGAAAGEPEPDLQRPTRTIFVKCRVRFEIEVGESS